MRLSILVICLFLFTIKIVFAQNSGQTTTRAKVQALATQIRKNHFAPKGMNDSLSSDIFKLFLEDLDPYKAYFSQRDINELEKYRYSLFEELLGKKWAFTDTVARHYHKAIGRTLEWTKKILNQPLEQGATDYLSLSENTPFAPNEAEQKKRWGQYLTWQVQLHIYDNWMMEYEGEQAGGAPQPPDTKSEWYQLEDSLARGQIARKITRRLTQLQGNKVVLQQHIDQLYLDAIARVFDPHTQYFDSRTEERFNESLSSQTLVYGFDWEEDEEGSFSITGLQPGSAAWNTGNIFMDDKVQQIKTADGKVKKAKDLSAKEMEDLLGKQGKEQIELTLKSADGKLKTVKLKKEEAENEDNTVRGYVLEGTKKIGYLSLPSFYTAWGGTEGSGCANDISKEIIKLKREKIEGLIFDLRYNGGGSLQEAVEIAGIFLEAGPMCLVRETDGKLLTLKDPTRGTIYDGALVVLINGQSASASELVAGTLQDYGRALIAGSASFGKATMQAVLPLDTNFNIEQLKTTQRAPKNSAEDYVKLTLGKLYRVNGKTNQLQGVIPDLHLPDPMEALGYTERKLPFALASDSVAIRVEYQKLANNFSPALGIQPAINQLPGIPETTQWIDKITKKQKELRVPLEWKSFVNWNSQWEPPAEKNDKETDGNFTYKPANTSYTERLLNLESDYKKMVNLDMLESLKNDLHIEVAYRAIQKLIL